MPIAGLRPGLPLTAVRDPASIVLRARRPPLLNAIAPDLWTAEDALRFFGLEIGVRMTVVRLEDGSLLLHSPIRPLPELVRAVEALGPVSTLVAPNCFHHLFIGDWTAPFPDAALVAAPGLDQKRPDLPIRALLSDAPEPAWKGALDQIVMGGVPALNEVVFFHPATSTLIGTDLAFNIGPRQPVLTRLAFRALGSYGTLTPSLAERLFVRDRAACRASLERILEWPFERAIVAHGDVCEQGAKEQLRRGYGWLLDR